MRSATSRHISLASPHDVMGGGFGRQANDRAPKARHIHSLGRQPQVIGVKNPRSPEGATDRDCGESRSHDLLAEPLAIFRGRGGGDKPRPYENTRRGGVYPLPAELSLRRRNALTGVFARGSAVCRRFAASHYSCVLILGLTPQAIHMPPLRGCLEASIKTQYLAHCEFLERTG